MTGGRPDIAGGVFMKHKAHFPLLRIFFFFVLLGIGHFIGKAALNTFPISWGRDRFVSALCIFMVMAVVGALYLRLVFAFSMKRRAGCCSLSAR